MKRTAQQAKVLRWILTMTTYAIICFVVIGFCGLRMKVQCFQHKLFNENLLLDSNNLQSIITNKKLNVPRTLIWFYFDAGDIKLSLHVQRLKYIFKTIYPTNIVQRYWMCSWNLYTSVQKCRGEAYRASRMWVILLRRDFQREERRGKQQIGREFVSHWEAFRNFEEGRNIFE